MELKLDMDLIPIGLELQFDMDFITILVWNSNCIWFGLELDMGLIVITIGLGMDRFG